MTETIWTTKPKICTIWPFADKSLPIPVQFFGYPRILVQVRAENSLPQSSLSLSFQGNTLVCHWGGGITNECF